MHCSTVATVGKGRCLVQKGWCEAVDLTTLITTRQYSEFLAVYTPAWLVVFISSPLYHYAITYNCGKWTNLFFFNFKISHHHKFGRCVKMFQPARGNSIPQQPFSLVWNYQCDELRSHLIKIELVV